MADTTIHNAPKNLDLTACYVSADGGATQTSLIDIQKSANDATAKVTKLEENIKDPIDTSTFLTKNNINKPNGVIGINAKGIVTIPVTEANVESTILIGKDLNGNTIPNFVRAYTNVNISNINVPYQELFSSPDGKSVQKQVWGTCFYPSNVNYTDLGKPTLPFNNIYVSNQPIVTSDISSKNVITNDISKGDYAKLLEAVFSVSASLYTMKIVAEEKGEDAARIHSGFIAQELEAAMIAQGLDPSLFAFWCRFPVYENIFTVTKDEKGNETRETEYVAKKDKKGNQLYAQALRYDELFVLLIEALKVKMGDVETRLSALETK